MVQPQQVYHDGVFIGEFDGSDDPFENMRRLRAFVSERLGPAEHNVAIACMNQAWAFRQTAQMLQCQPYDKRMFYPLIVNLAFSLELYLKTLCATSENAPRGHHLDKLLDQVPPDALAAIERIIPTVKIAECDLHDLPGLRHALVEMRNAFVEWRYAFERGGSGSFHLPWMIWANDVLHRACIEVLTPVVNSRKQGEKKLMRSTQTP